MANAALRNPVQDQTAHGSAAEFKLEQFLPYRLNVLALLVSTALSRVYSERHGIGVAEWRVLVTLGQYGVMTGNAVGGYGQLHKTKVSRAVALLERRKLVTRRANREDMREAFLSLTPAGREIYDELTPIAMKFADELLEVVDIGDRAALDRAVTRLTERSAALTAELAARRAKPNL
jgi:DNA-binding MarR family transcriptional regulator